ncbi:MAG: serine/threonine-protein kinase, partial [Elainellaceae cyanobacterium]
ALAPLPDKRCLDKLCHTERTSLLYFAAMSYCINPDCPNPAEQKTPDPSRAKFCSNCGASLQLSGRYRTLTLLGKGDLGRTFLAVDEHKPSKPPCVLKQLVGLPSQGLEPGTDESTLFRREALRLEKLGQHPQIPALMAFFEQGRHRYLVQEFIDGVSLDQQLQEQGTFTEIQIRSTLNDILPVLQFVHIHQIIHRDIKPRNLIRILGADSTEANQKSGTLFLVDFGTAKFATTTNLLQTGTKINSQRYGPPELAAGRATFSSDLYQLGVTCIQLLTHKPLSELFDQRRCVWDWENHLDQPVSEDLIHVLNQMVEQELRKRYKAANEVLDDLNRSASAIGDRPTFVPTPVNRRKGETSKPPVSLGADQPKTLAWECTHILKGHQAWVRSVALSADGKILVSGSGDKTVRIWSVTRGQLLHTLSGHSSWVRAVNISPDQRLIASVSNDKTIRLWHLQTGVHQCTLTGHQDSIRTVAFSPVQKISSAQQTEGLLATGGQDKLIHLWDINHGKILRTLAGHEHWVVALAFHPNGQLLFSSSRDRTIRLWDVSTGQCLGMLLGHTAEVTGLAISPDGRSLISCSADQTIRIWDTKSRQLTQTLQGHAGTVNSVVMHPNGKELASGSNDKSIKLWSLDGELIATLLGHTGWVWTLAFATEKAADQPHTILASGCWDGNIHIWQRSPRSAP